jgi:AraC family transcriptional regulator
MTVPASCRRLELSALRLAYESDRSITDIALSSGYSSSSNFAKAFSAYFGVSPSRVQKPEQGLPASIGQLTARYGKNFDPSALYSVIREQDERAHAAQRRLPDAFVITLRLATTTLPSIRTDGRTMLCALGLTYMA